ncbi:paramyosin-like isoform X8 [Aphanomyces euteiches]|nr:paramyosin-like isoform X8 [Aphanomyces euteiches]KAH9094759.1 paramyosin-like isoform X8 [Aphanomyces euteiches]
MSNQDEPTSVLSYFPAGYTDSERYLTKSINRFTFYVFFVDERSTSMEYERPTQRLTLPKKFVDTIGGSDPVDDCHVLVCRGNKEEGVRQMKLRVDKKTLSSDKYCYVPARVMEFLQVKERDVIYILHDEQAIIPQSSQAVVFEQAMQELFDENVDLKSQLGAQAAIQAKERSAHEMAVMALQAHVSTLEASNSAAEATIASLEAKMAAMEGEMAALAATHAAVVDSHNKEKKDSADLLHGLYLKLDDACTHANTLGAHAAMLEEHITNAKAAKAASRIALGIRQTASDAAARALRTQVARLEDNLARVESTAARREADLVAEIAALQDHVETFCMVEQERLAREAAAAEEALNQRFALPEQEVREMLQREQKRPSSTTS